MKNFAKDAANQLLQQAGIKIDGENPWDLQIKENKFYRRVMKQGALGLGESYMDGWWECPRIDMFFERLARSHAYLQIQSSWQGKLKHFFYKFINEQSKNRARDVGKRHYDLGNELFSKMLDPSMNYSCAYWKEAHTLAEAQQAKMDLICKKLQLKPGMNVLDVGCGWGALAKYAAEHYQVSVVGITISKEQYQYAKSNCAGLPIEIRLQDYRDINEQYDRVVSVGMFEHVGYVNYPAFMQMAHRALKEDGLFLLHTIGSNITSTESNEWIRTYIFPHGMLPSVTQISEAACEGLFVLEDWHSFGADYDKTLMAWYENFNRHWSELKDQYDERFHRMWNYYLLSCAGGFRARDIQLWQIVFSKNGMIGGYQAPR